MMRRNRRWMLLVAITGLALPLLSPAPEAQAQGSPDFMAGRLFQVALEMAPGFSPIGAPGYGTLSEGQTHTVEQPVTAGTCYVWIGAGDSGQTDLDLTVRVEGSVVAVDDAPDDWPIAQYCATADTTATVELVMQEGSGGFAFNGYSRHFGGSDALEIQMNYLAGMFAPGHTPAGPMTRAQLEAGAEERFPLSLEGGRCYSIIGTGGPGVADIDFFLMEAATGQVVQSDVAPDAAPILGVCPPDTGEYILRLVMYQGSGDVAWQPFSISFD